MGNVSKKSLREKLATAYKISDVNCPCLRDENGFRRWPQHRLRADVRQLAAAKKFEPKHRLKRVGLDVPSKTGRRNRKDLRHRQAKLRGKAKGKAAASS